MAKRSDIPIENRNYSHYYFICSALLALTTFWAVLEMIWVRSPWQRMQREFNQTEMRQLEAERKQALDGIDRNRLASLQKQLTEAQTSLSNGEYHQALADSQRISIEIEKAVQNYRFKKSEADAEYYLFKEAQYHGDTEAYEQRGKKVDKLNSEAAEWKKKWDEAEARKTGMIDQLVQYRRRVTDLQGEIAAMHDDVEDLSFRIDRAQERKIKIQQVVMPEFVKGNFSAYVNNVDRCHTCHVAYNRKGFENMPEPYRTHPSLDTLLAIHSVERFGCSPCHEGQGTALQDVKFAHGFAKHWEHPLHEREFITAGCNKCHGRELRTEHAPVLNKAKRMVVDLGCYGCHEIRGFENAERIGPNLGRITQKLTPGWVYGWLRNNREFRPHTRMPNPQFTEAEARASTAFLFSLQDSVAWTPARIPGRGNAENGERLVETAGCKGCHVVGDEDRALRPNDLPYDVAPDLGVVGAKASTEWLYDWIKDPKRFSRETRMPNLRLSDQEAADIVAYLAEQSADLKLPKDYRAEMADLQNPQLIAEGRAIVRNFGCHGCHVIPGMEREGRVSVSLNEFGAKTTEELFYGDALASGEVPDKTWEAWTIGKLKNSRLYATEAVIQRMPNFQMADEDATTMAVLLRSWDGRVIGERYVKPWRGRDENIHAGRLLVRKYNCTGCHIIEGEGGDLRPLLTAALMMDGMDETAASAYAPPNLHGEGEKVQSEWLFEFLKQPKTGQIRPWLRTRMPTFEFSDADANTLVAYFKALSGEMTGFTQLEQFDLTAEQRRAATQLVSRDMFACFSCHQQGNKKPEGPPDGWAPDLNMASQRLNPDWIAKWIRDPQVLQPGTRMPSFYPDSYPPEILNGDPNEQIIALRNYLVTLSR